MVADGDTMELNFVGGFGGLLGVIVECFFDALADSNQSEVGCAAADITY